MTGTRNRGADMGWLRKFGSGGAHKSVLAASGLSLEDCVLRWDDIEKQAKAQHYQRNFFGVRLCVYVIK